MTREQARYDIATLPMRQASLRAFAREPTTSVEGLRIYRREYQANKARLVEAHAVLGDEAKGVR